MQIAINPSLIDTILVILFPSIPRRPWFERRIFHPQNVLLTQIRCYCARGGFFSATVEVIGAPSFEIAWKFILRWQRAAYSQQQQARRGRANELSLKSGKI